MMKPSAGTGQYVIVRIDSEFIWFPVELSWVVSVGRAELFAAWFRALVPGSGPVLRFHAYASASVLLLALFFLPAFPILFPSLLQSGPSIDDTVTDQKTCVPRNERIPLGRECFPFTGLD